ncbi:MAG: hypothetical protein RR052_05310, partial [Oscillospiraceae bacterium]
MEKNKKEITCSACGGALRYLGLQTLGINQKKRKSVFGVTDKQLDVEIYECENCGKIEMYNVILKKNKPLKQVLPTEMTCSRCGKVYETEYGHCPYCGWEEED